MRLRLRIGLNQNNFGISSVWWGRFQHLVGRVGLACDRLTHIHFRSSFWATMSKQRSTLSKGRNFNAKLVRHCCRFWQQSRTLLRQCCQNGNIVEATYDIVAFDNVASTLLLVWTGRYEMLLPIPYDEDAPLAARASTGDLQDRRPGLSVSDRPGTGVPGRRLSA